MATKTDRRKGCYITDIRKGLTNTTVERGTIHSHNMGLTNATVTSGNIMVVHNYFLYKKISKIHFSKFMDKSDAGKEKFHIRPLAIMG